MSRTLRTSQRLFFAFLFALSSMVQQEADVRLLRTEGCAVWDACRGQRNDVTLGEATDALAAAVVRQGVVTLRVVHRGGSHGAERAGEDVLFRARNDLLVARARAALDDLLDQTLTIHAATQGIASAASRAPPAVS